jgi:hypothetical protein
MRRYHRTPLRFREHRYRLSREGVDPKRIAIQGIQGGYWVPRAVAFEKRIAAAIADPGVIDVSASSTVRRPHARCRGDAQLSGQILPRGNRAPEASRPFSMLSRIAE